MLYNFFNTKPKRKQPTVFVIKHIKYKQKMKTQVFFSNQMNPKIQGQKTTKEKSKDNISKTSIKGVGANHKGLVK